MGSTSVQTSRAGVLVAILLAARLVGLIGLAGGGALACAQPPSTDPTPPGAGRRANAAVLRVGTSGDYAPFSLWASDAREPEGFSIAVARAFAASRGERIEWVRFRWSELASAIEARRFDLALSGITVRPDRSTLGRFSLPLTTTGATALVLASSPLTTPVDLERPGLRIAVNRGGHLERVARTLFGQARIESIGANAVVPTRLADDRADAVLTDDLEGPAWQGELPPTRAIGPLTRDRKAAWFPLGKEELLLEFDRWLLTAECSGELARLRHQYGLAEARTAAALPALLARLDERLALMPAVARAKRTLARAIEDPAQEERVRVAARASAARAAREFEVEPPPEPALRRFVDAQLAAARFVQSRALASTAGAGANTAGAEANRAMGGGAPETSADGPRFESARIELEEQLRPAVSFLMERILWLAVASTAANQGSTRVGGCTSGTASSLTPASHESVAEALSAHALPPELEAEIRAALEALKP